MSRSARTTGREGRPGTGNVAAARYRPRAVSNHIPSGYGTWSLCFRPKRQPSTRCIKVLRGKRRLPRHGAEEQLTVPKASWEEAYSIRFRLQRRPSGRRNPRGSTGCSILPRPCSQAGRLYTKGILQRESCRGSPTEGMLYSDIGGALTLGGARFLHRFFRLEIESLPLYSLARWFHNWFHTWLPS